MKMGRIQPIVDILIQILSPLLYQNIDVTSTFFKHTRENKSIGLEFFYIILEKKSKQNPQWVIQKY
jgi:hypothetical protein